MKPAPDGAPRTTASLHGHRALVVPVLPCEECGQDMPADHPCPAAAVRRSLRGAAATVHASPGALETIWARTRQPAALAKETAKETAP